MYRLYKYITANAIVNMLGARCQCGIPVVDGGYDKPLHCTRNASTTYCASRKSFFPLFSENKKKVTRGLKSGVRGNGNLNINFVRPSTHK